MKTRYIRGISKLPERAGIVLRGKVMGGDIGSYPVVCPTCDRPTLWALASKKKPAANVCTHCKNVKVYLEDPDFNLAHSAVRLEVFARGLSSDISDNSLAKWAVTYIKNERYRWYLHLHSTDITPKIGGQRVSSMVYHRMLRYIMFLSIPHDEWALKILRANMVNIGGAALLRPPDEIIRVLGPATHAESLSHRERAEIARLLDHNSLGEILRIYGVPDNSIFDEVL